MKIDVEEIFWIVLLFRKSFLANHENRVVEVFFGRVYPLFGG